MRGRMPRTHWPCMSHSPARMRPKNTRLNLLLQRRLHETLTGAGAPLLGVVANGLKSGRRGGYGYGYSYDYAGVGGPASGEGVPPAGGASPNGASAADAPVPTSQS